MTELQLAIARLKETISVGNVLLGKMEKEQKDFETPSPHIWKHMDVFRNSGGCGMIYIACGGFDPEVFCIGLCTKHSDESTSDWLENAEFLFNLREKL